MIAVVAILAFFVIQIGVPASRLGDEEVRRFGWQMYSDADRPVSFSAARAVGDQVVEEDVDLKTYMPIVRLDIDLVRYLPPHICSVDDRVLRVTWEAGVHEC